MAVTIKTEHNFGGAWTQVKLKMLGKYLNAFSYALSKQNFILHYADAFAGTGTQSIKSDKAQSQLLETEDFKGSAKVALDTNKFNHYHFNDLKKSHFDQLCDIRDMNPDKSIKVSRLDANEFIEGFCGSLGPKDRAVLFLDPYATELKWSTLKIVAASKKVDLWLLFPISSLTRMTPRKGSNPDWDARVERLLGDSDWKSKIYSTNNSNITGDLFGDPEALSQERIDQHSLNALITQRLQSIFAFASEPMTLKNKRQSPLFSLYFCVSNDTPKAVSLARKIASSILNQPVQLE